MEGNLQTRGKQVKEPAAEESNEQYLERIFRQEPDAVRKEPGFREFVLSAMAVIGSRPSGANISVMYLAYKGGAEYQKAIKRTAMDVVRALGSMVTRPGLPFTYADDIGQIGEHDVFFGGVELTQDVGEFKAGHKFASASIDFHAGHLTFSTSAGREHRYDFAIKVGAKHEGHTCTGCGSVVGQPCSQHA
jgi:hypothetical protein